MTVEERFKLIYPRIQKLAGKYSATTQIPYEEFESDLSFEFMAIDKGFDPKVNNSYSAYMGAMLDLKAKRMCGADRKERRFYDNVSYAEEMVQNEVGEEFPYEFEADVDIEEEIFDVMFVEEQLAKADDVTRKILVEFFADPHVSFREIARKLGLHDKLVKRRLESVAQEVRGA